MKLFFEFYLNGELIGTNNQWWKAQSWDLNFKEGVNNIAIKGINLGGPGAIIGDIRIGSSRLTTNSSWSLNTEVDNNYV